MNNKINGNMISIIVPVYNVECYLDKCLKSLSEQTYSKIEVIMVDDGSEDTSGLICERWVHQDRRFIVIHQENAGVSAARNRGLKMAKGEFVCFVDADDFVSCDMCEVLLSHALKYKTEIVMSSYKYIFNDDLPNSFIEDECCQILSRDEVIYKITDLKYPMGINAVAKLYKAEIAKNHLFKEGYPLGEDQEYVFESIRNVNRVCIVNRSLYFYVYRQGSAMHKCFSTIDEKNWSIYMVI